MPYQLADSDDFHDMLVRFGMGLRRCRHHRGLSQDALARRSGVSQATISRLEHGKAPYASLHLILRISDALEPAMPLAFCPHDHGCIWQRRDASDTPIGRIDPVDAWWHRSTAPARAEAGLPGDPLDDDAVLVSGTWPDDGTWPADAT
jgi:transcriptional regulator with XRE-family HTH domain